MNAGAEVATPLIVVGTKANIAEGAAKTVLCPSKETVWPIVAVEEPGRMNIGVAVGRPSIVVGLNVKTGVVGDAGSGAGCAITLLCVGVGQLGPPPLPGDGADCSPLFALVGAVFPFPL